MDPDALVRTLVPPPLFAEVGFDSYRTRSAAADAGSSSCCVAGLLRANREPRSVSRELVAASAAAAREGRAGLYLDGGFGVGKTHLLAVAVARGARRPRLFGTFVELTNLVGALGFADAVERLAQHRLLCIDEFELDDPGDTVLMSTLLQRLAERG